jgi:very-short-patch-repair endonuclease
MAQRLNIKQVRQEFEKEKYRLLSRRYEGAHAKLDYICPQGHRNRMTWSNFKHRRSRCPECYGNKKLTLIQVRAAFKKRGFGLLSQEYRGNTSKLWYECPKRHKNQITWSDFKQGTGCSMCSQRKPLTVDSVINLMEQEGYQLLSDNYKNNKTKLRYLCSKKHEGAMTWSDFQQGTRCSKCREFKGQRRLGNILEKIFPGQVQRQDNLGFLGRQTVDYSVHEHCLAFEYDGIQHFEPVTYGSISYERAEENFKIQQERDRRKERLCRKNGYHLIRITYADRMSLQGITERIEEVCGA